MSERAEKTVLDQGAVACRLHRRHSGHGHHDPAVRTVPARLCAGITDPRQRAVRAFELVRDEIQYEFRAKLLLDEYRATHVLAEGRGFCVQKAVLLCSLLHAAEVPAALVLCDLRDYTLPARVVRAMGTDTMFHHGLTAIHLDGRWLLADASLSPEMGYRV